MVAIRALFAALILSIALWAISGGPFLWLIVHVILNWR